MWMHEMPSISTAPNNQHNVVVGTHIVDTTLGKF